MNEPMQPAYYVQHPDGSYSEAAPQPVLLTKDVPLVMLCSKCFGWGRIGAAPCDHCGGIGHYAEEPRAAGVEGRTLYDQRTAIDDACRDAAPQLYAALRNLLDAVRERRDNCGIESVVIADATAALATAGVKGGQGG